MPVTLFKDVISDRLSEFGFTRDPIETPPDPGNVLKERILSGDKVEIDIINDERFILTISESQYSRILSSSYWYSMQKVREQRRLIDTHNVRSLPLAWLLVTAYYSAFYSAVELSRLFGLYNLNLTQDQSSSVVGNSNSSIVLKKGTFSGAIEYELKDAVRIIFSRQDVKPHELAWKNMREILGVNNRNNLLVSKKQKFDLINELLNSQKRRLKMPNNVRN
ncbi:hypothetical protein [Amphritea pacifica]|uniref:hypothetical protein n=1 Tax=Amphritea pacifica TaxID=2811233 RepID=UPI0019642B08|nr:hypothetical protein [Amphritea pacifica]MBN1009096.1 hypothetical protein [Amphritea pacifica]